MKIKELKVNKEKDLKSLQSMVSKLRIELIKNEVKVAGGKEKNLKTTWRIRKEIAQLLSIIKSK